VIAERFRLDVEVDEVMKAPAHGGTGMQAAELAPPPKIPTA